MPEDVIGHYQLRDKVTHDGYVYCEIQKGMDGLPQAGIIAQQLLEECLPKPNDPRFVETRHMSHQFLPCC